MSKKFRFNSPLHVVKRMNISKRNTWFIRVGAILVAFLLSGILCTLICPGSFGTFFAAIFRGTFSTKNYIFNTCCCFGIYLLLSLAVAPAFKMRFWNIGAEGQAMCGCIVTAVILYFLPKSVPSTLVIIIAAVAAVCAGMLWSTIPTFFKIKFNTNETLFTLMMNYIAIGLAAFTINLCDKSGQGNFPLIRDNTRLIISIGGTKYIPIIVIAIVFTILMYLYLKKTKQGFELSIIGSSTNTAKYVGINIAKVSYRTMMMSGAIAGLVGFLLVCGQNRTLTTSLVGGKGFTAVLIAWLGHFNPAEIALYSFVIGFIDQGTFYAASQMEISTAYFTGMILGFFILIIIIAEFFARYQIKIRKENCSKWFLNVIRFFSNIKRKRNKEPKKVKENK